MRRKLGWPYKNEFACHRCGNCCRGDGAVAMTDDDIARAAAYLRVEPQDFVREYCQRYGDDELILRDQADEQLSCIFLIQDDKGRWGCRIHEAKPAQCAAFPFMWRPKNVLDYCEGMRAVAGLEPLGDGKLRTMNE